MVKTVCFDVLVCVMLTILQIAQGAPNKYSHEFYATKFYEYTQTHNLAWRDGTEFVRRLSVFADNWDKIEAHNNKFGVTYTMAINKFAHYTLDEFHTVIHSGTKPPLSIPRQQCNSTSDSSSCSSPPRVSQRPNAYAPQAKSIDWVALGAVTPAKDQGQCGSCWAFSTTGALEGAYFVKSGTLLSFSEQQLVSCDTSNGGCDGGWMDNAFSWLGSHGGITQEADYPYTSGTSQSNGSCDPSQIHNVPNTAPTGYTDVPAGSVSDLQQAVQKQPVAIAIDASDDAFQFYSSGVITSGCNQELDHGVLLVGYGKLQGVPYWKVKNSWGDTWGMAGYILIERSAANQCGILDAASYPSL